MTQQPNEQFIEVETPHGKVRVTFPKEFLDYYGKDAMKFIREAINTATVELATRNRA